MRHGMVNRKLGRTAGHRAALFRNQLASLIDKERIITTLPKAKELRPQIERLVTLGRTDNIHNRRQAARLIGEAEVGKLFDTLGPRFANTPGGYTRIIKLGARRGDAAEMAILEFVGYEPPQEAAEVPAADAKAAKPKKAAKKEEPAEGEAAAEEKPKKAAPKKAAPKKEAKPKAEKAEKPKAAAKPAAKGSSKKASTSKKKSGK
jgi:large subunit ribosomal protein L17